MIGVIETPRFFSTKKGAQCLDITQEHLRRFCRESAIKAAKVPNGKYRIHFDVPEE